MSPVEFCEASLAGGGSNRTEKWQTVEIGRVAELVGLKVYKNERAILCCVWNAWESVVKELKA